MEQGFRTERIPMKTKFGYHGRRHRIQLLLCVLYLLPDRLRRIAASNGRHHFYDYGLV